MANVWSRKCFSCKDCTIEKSRKKRQIFLAFTELNQVTNVIYPLQREAFNIIKMQTKALKENYILDSMKQPTKNANI